MPFRITIILCLFSSSSFCGDGEQPGWGHRKMISLLQEIKLRSIGENVYIGDGKARALRAQLAGLNPATPTQKRAELHYALGEAEIRLGNERASIEHYQKALALLPGGLVGPNRSKTVGVQLRLGVAWLRLGETENCCLRQSPDSCILPIRGGGVHQKREGSSEAIKCFSRILQITRPGSYSFLESQWLLNVAHMTLGTWPDQVPLAYRIGADAFKSEQAFPRFNNIAARLKLDTFSLAGGAIAEDFDGDDDLDLVVSSADPSHSLRFFRNSGDGSFSDQSDAAGLAGLYGGLNILQADYDNDGDVDVLVLRGGWLFHAGRIPNSLLQNQGDGTFVDITFEAGLGQVNYPTQTAAWADYDNDGDLDLYIGNESFSGVSFPGQLFNNQGNGTFKDLAGLAGVAQEAMTKSVVWGDYDGDRRPDLYVSNYGAPNRLYHNQGDGTFRDVAPGLGVDKPIESFPAWFWDYNNDGHLDLYVSAYLASAGDVAAGYQNRVLRPGSLAHLYRSDGKGGFEEVGRQSNLNRANAPMGCNFGDLDSDGWLDIYLGTGWPNYEALMPNLVYRNRQGAGFADITSAIGLGHLQKGHGVVFADLDNDGDQDVFEQMGGFYQGDRYYDALYENPGSGNQWLTVELIGTTSNRSAIGARIRLDVEQAGGSRSIYVYVNSGASFGANPLRRFIGLGKATAITRLEVFWPTTGKSQLLKEVEMSRFIRIREGVDGCKDIILNRVKLGR